MTAMLLLSMVAVYFLAVRALRYRRRQALQAKVTHMKETHAYANITPVMAQNIAHVPILYDMPFLSRLGAQVALFKTYGIVSFTIVDTAFLTSNFAIRQLSPKSS